MAPIVQYPGVSDRRPGADGGAAEDARDDQDSGVVVKRVDGSAGASAANGWRVRYAYSIRGEMASSTDQHGNLRPCN